MMDKAEFLRRYEALCREGGWFVSACGCCESPWVLELGKDKLFDPDRRGFKDEIEENIKHLESA